MNPGMNPWMAAVLLLVLAGVSGLYGYVKGWRQAMEQVEQLERQAMEQVERLERQAMEQVERLERRRKLAGAQVVAPVVPANDLKGANQ